MHMGEAAPVAVVCFELTLNIRTAGSNPTNLDRLLHTSSMCYSSTRPINDTDDGIRSELFRSPLRPSHHGAIYVSALGPSIFSPQIHQSYDAPRMAGDSAQRERNLLHDRKHSSKCTRDDMEHTRHCLSCIFVLRQLRCFAAHRFGSRRATSPAKDIIRDTSLISWRRHFTT